MPVSLDKPDRNGGNINIAGNAPMREYTPEHILTEEQAAAVYGKQAADPAKPVREYAPEHIMDEIEASPGRPETSRKTRTSIHIGTLDVRIETERRAKTPARPDIQDKGRDVPESRRKIRDIGRENRAFRRSQAIRALILMTAGLLCLVGSRFITPKTLPADSVASKLAAAMGSMSGLILPFLGTALAVSGICAILKLVIRR